MAIRRGAPGGGALTAAKPNPFEAMMAETQAPDPAKPAAPPMASKPAMPATMKSHMPGGVKRRPLKFGKM